MRIAFLGTPDFALPSLQAMFDEGHEITVFTQPDRKKGRGGRMSMPSVKELALSLGLPVMQFEQIRCEEGIRALKAFAPELMITVAFGQLLTAEILDIPKHGCINVHASLLPEYRGAAPIQQAVIDGKKVTGVTTMMTDVGLDTGDILLVRETEIGENETAGELFCRLSVMGAEVLRDTVRALLDGCLTRKPQDNSLAVKCRTIKKEQARIDFSKAADEIHNLVRGMNPWPVAYTMWNGETVKIHKTLLHPEMQTDAKPGTCVTASAKQGLFVATGNGVIEVLSIQFPNSRVMTAKELLNSRKLLDEVFI